MLKRMETGASGGGKSKSDTVTNISPSGTNIVCGFQPSKIYIKGILSGTLFALAYDDEQKVYEQNIKGNSTMVTGNAKTYITPTSTGFTFKAYDSGWGAATYRYLAVE